MDLILCMRKWKGVLQRGQVLVTSDHCRMHVKQKQCVHQNRAAIKDNTQGHAHTHTHMQS